MYPAHMCYRVIESCRLHCLYKARQHDRILGIIQDGIIHNSNMGSHRLDINRAFSGDYELLRAIFYLHPHQTYKQACNQDTTH